MTRTQLSYFYAYARTPYKEDREAIAVLKKILLLELKSSPQGILVVSGKEWFKNDLLTFFDSPLDSTFDYQAFMIDYPWVESLKEPEHIFEDKNILTVDFSDDRFRQFAESESSMYEDDFFSTFRNRLMQQLDDYVSALLAYQKCFSSAFQLKLQTEIRITFLNRFNKIIALSDATPSKQLSILIKSADFFRCDGFYKLMREVADGDTELTNLNLEALSRVISRKEDVLYVKKVVRNQLTLRHSPEGKLFLNQLKEQLGKVKVFSDETNTKQVVGVIFIMVMILGAVFKMTGKPRISVEPYTPADYLKIEKNTEFHRAIKEAKEKRDSAIMNGAPDSFVLKEIHLH